MALKRGKIGHNRVERVDRPLTDEIEIDTINATQLARLIGAIAGHPYEALFFLACHTVMRWGELTGLRWRDLDLAKRELRVRKSQIEVDGQCELVEPKTKSSKRTIALSERAVAILKAHKAALGALPHPQSRVFMAPGGGPLRRSNFRKRVWVPLRKAAKIPEHVTFHAATRHAMASLALAGNVNPKLVQERLGHSRIATTMDIYSHTMPEQHHELAGQLDALIEGAQSD